MARVKSIDDLLAEQAVRKAVTCYSRGVDRCDIEILKSAFHHDAEVRFGSYDGPYAAFCESVVASHGAMNYTTHTVVNEYYDIDAESGTGVGEIYVLAFLSLSKTGNVMEADDNESNESEGGHEYLVAGRYIDKYECRDGDWRISLRQYIYDWSRTSEYTGHDPNGLFGELIYRGTQNKNDISYSILGD